MLKLLRRYADYKNRELVELDKTIISMKSEIEDYLKWKIQNYII